MKKIYFNKKIINGYPHTIFLAPILGLYQYGEGNLDGIDWKFYDENELKEREKKGKDVITYSSIEDCDFVVYPKNFIIDLYLELKKESIIAKKYNKKIIVFFNSDIEAPIPDIDNIIVFRTSLNRESPKNEYAMPYFCPEIQTNNKINQNDEVSIGYVGYQGNPSLMMKIWNYIRSVSFLKSFLNKLIFSYTFKNLIKDKRCITPSMKMNTLAFQLLQVGKGDIVRNKIIKNLMKSRYKFNFIRRDKVLNPKINKNLKDEYIKNMLESTFVLVARGFGNNAYRLFEAMSIGAIPLLIDTGIKLPFDNEINYKNLFVWVPFDDIKKIDKYIYTYLKKNGENLCNIRKEIKNIFDNNLRMYHFFKKVANHIDDYKN